MSPLWLCLRLCQLKISRDTLALSLLLNRYAQIVISQDWDLKWYVLSYFHRNPKQKFFGQTNSNRKYYSITFCILKNIFVYGSIESLDGKIKTDLFFYTSILSNPKFLNCPLYLIGQIGMIICFQDSLASNLVKLLHDMGSNNGLSFVSETLDINNQLVFFYR